MTALGSYMRCAGCGERLAADEPLPLQCPRTGELPDHDHVLRAELELEGTSFPDRSETNPFVRFRRLMHTYRLARRQGMSDDDYIALVRDLDDSVHQVDGRRFEETPYSLSDDLGVWFKNETVQPSGSHKSRHLMGIAIHLEVIDRLGLAATRETPLAIASCGNAALAAAVIARAVGRKLRVFVPPSAAESVTRRLSELGAEQVVCERSPDLPLGDPCYHRYREAVAAGALPFACQGNENGMTIAGGMTLGWELALQHRAQAEEPLDRLFVQVGGGALASSVFQALDVAVRLGVLASMPTLHAVQTSNAHPLWVAWSAVASKAEEVGVAAALEHAASHRSEYMRPWPNEPESLAYGILDDETYDWLTIVRGLVTTGGSVPRVGEDRLRATWKQAREATGIDVCATGIAGLAGALSLRDAGELATEEQVAVLFTGTRR
ncbi:MAG: pyridoxal-phosphate dependent enzyme [Deltaproteobacteria bacterium]|nr:pyridoxal-phosphate dependent enzyme [Deltaproteobacteria bacterium]